MPRINAVPGERRVLSPHYPRAHTSPALLQDTLHGAGQEPGPVTPLLSSEMARPPPRIRGEGPDGLVPSSSQPRASLNPETLGQRGGREWTLPPVGRAQGKPSDWVCSVLSPEGSPCGQGTGLQEVQGLAPQLHVTRSSHLAIRTPASRSAERVFPASHGQAVLGLTCPVTASGSPGPDGWCGYSPSGAQGWASASLGQQAAPGSPDSSRICPTCPHCPCQDTLCRQLLPPLLPVFTLGLPSLDPRAQVEMWADSQGPTSPPAPGTETLGRAHNSRLTGLFSAPAPVWLHSVPGRLQGP